MLHLFSMIMTFRYYFILYQIDVLTCLLSWNNDIMSMIDKGFGHQIEEQPYETEFAENDYAM